MTSLSTVQSRIQKPQFARGVLTQMSSEDLVALTRPILQKRISETKYDRVVIACQFLTHYFLQKNLSPLEALHCFKIDGSLEQNQGNSCVALSFDLISLLPSQIRPYLAAATLSDRYQQFAGPLYSHVTPIIAFQNPRDAEDAGFILLDPSFHIAEPIVVKKDHPFAYQMGKKKGVWRFSQKQNRIVCQPGPQEGEAPWPIEKTLESKMVYRTDSILNPEESSALPMFAIDRSYPIVSRNPDGRQAAHINIELNKKEISWKIGEERRDPISFEAVLTGAFRFDSETADLLLIDRDELNDSVSRIVQYADILDAMYRDYLAWLRGSSEFRSILKDPDSL